MTCSFYIWLAQNITSWEVEQMSLPTIQSPTNQASCQNSQRFSRASQNIISKEASISTASKHVGLGNICYANSVLQAISVR